MHSYDFVSSQNLSETLLLTSQIGPWMKAVELPTVPTKILFGKAPDKTQLEKVRSVAQNYFDAVLSDEKLSGSELIYAFLSPSPEHLKQAGTQRKKSKFSFSTFFKGYIYIVIRMSPYLIIARIV